MKKGSLVRLVAALFLISFLLLAACSREEGERVIGDGYASSANPQIRDRLGAGATVIGTLKAGEYVQILQKRRRWVRVRTKSNQEGWLDERHIIPRESFERFQQAVKNSVAMPSQGAARARAMLNLHLEPSRTAPSFFQLAEGESCEVLQHRAVEVPVPGGTAPPKPAEPPAGSAKPPAPPPAPPTPPPTAKRGKAKAKGKSRKAAVPSGPKMEDWYLVRGKGKAGWVLASRIDMAVPDEVAQYAEGKTITAWQVLNRVQSGDEKKAQYVWATSERAGAPYDFDSIRVFIWNPPHHRYETSYRERNQRGLYPLTVGRAEVQGFGEVPSFTVLTQDGAGNRVSRQFVLLGNIVRRKEQ